MARIWVVEFRMPGYAAWRPLGSSCFVAWAFRRRIDAFHEMNSAAAEFPKTEYRVSEYVRVERIAAKKGRK